MKYSVLVLFVLIAGAAFVCGCTESPAPAATPVPTAATPAVVATTAAQPSFTLGDHFFEKKYSWQDGNEVYSEQFVVKQDQPWGIGYDVTLLNDDPSKCWFEVAVIDMNNPSNPSMFGYGGAYPTELSQVHPVYGAGSYKVEMKGNFIKVDMKAAKRNP